MRVALIRKTYTPFGGAERQVDRFFDALRTNGHEVHLYAANWTKSASPRSDVMVHQVPVITALRWVEVWLFAARASWMAAEGGYDLVHSFDRVVQCDVYRAGDGVHREWLKRRRASRAWRRCLPSLNPLHAVYLRLERGLFEGRARAIIANSNRGKADILAHYRADPDRIRVIYNGVDLVRFRPPSDEERWKARAEAGFGEREHVLLLVGSGFARKGVDAAIQALARNPAHDGLVVIGRGDPAPYMRTAARLCVADRVRFVGPVTDVTPWYHAADVLVLPTIYDPFANVCLEALASGLPVITTAANGAAEVLTPETGIVVDRADDIEALAGALKAAAEWGRTRVDACRAVAEQYSEERQVRETLALYDELKSPSKFSRS